MACTDVPGAERDDPDIAGIGVIIGFMLSAYVTLILVIIHYLIDHQNTQNPIDRAWIKFLTPKSWNNPQGRPSKKWSQALESAVLLYSDSQVLTGIAILLCTYSQLQHGISIYHWQTAVKLAWFSSVTHLTTLTSLRAYFRDRPVMAFWRVVFMGVTLLLLMIALIPTGYTSDIQWYNDIPATCLYSKGHPLGNFNRPLIAFSLIFLLTSYVTRVVKLFTPLSGLAHKWLRVAPGNLLKKFYILTKKQRDNDASRVLEKITWASLQWFSILAYVLFKAIYDIGESMLWEIIWLLMALAWGTIRLLTRVNWSDASGEMEWRFGQFMAVMLSTFPLWSIYTRLQEIEYEESRRAHLISTSPIPTSSTLASQQPLAHLRLYQSAWFPKLIILMFALALGIAASVLYVVPAEPSILSADGAHNPLGLFPPLIPSH